MAEKKLEKSKAKTMELLPESEWPELNRTFTRDDSYYISWIGDKTFYISLYDDSDYVSELIR